MESLLLRFDAPMMSFGGVRVDAHNKTDLFPGRSMLAGLFANALGWVRQDAAAHDRLQARIRYAARLDRRGSVLVDYQTVDFDSEGAMASELGWTSSGKLEERRGGAASEGTHIRYRHYVVDAVLTVAVTLEPIEDQPSLRRLSDAVRYPARPLFLGRRCCVPSAPLWLGESSAPSLKEALVRVPRLGGERGERGGRATRGDAGALTAIWPPSDGREEDRSRLWPRVEDRDWANSIHVGRRIYVEGLIDPVTAPGGDGAGAHE